MVNQWFSIKNGDLVGITVPHYQYPIESPVPKASDVPPAGLPTAAAAGGASGAARSRG